ncbi:hypothetical protein T439DRAFT_322183 [Meredithblackwellia eburnea MCA 4105]
MDTLPLELVGQIFDHLISDLHQLERTSPVLQDRCTPVLLSLSLVSKSWSLVTQPLLFSSPFLTPSFAGEWLNAIQKSDPGIIRTIRVAPDSQLESDSRGWEGAEDRVVNSMLGRLLEIAPNVEEIEVLGCLPAWESLNLSGIHTLSYYRQGTFDSPSVPPIPTDFCPAHLSFRLRPAPLRTLAQIDRHRFASHSHILSLLTQFGAHLTSVNLRVDETTIRHLKKWIIGQPAFRENLKMVELGSSGRSPEWERDTTPWSQLKVMEHLSTDWELISYSLPVGALVDVPPALKRLRILHTETTQKYISTGLIVVLEDLYSSLEMDPRGSVLVLELPDQWRWEPGRSDLNKEWEVLRVCYY